NAENDGLLCFDHAWIGEWKDELRASSAAHSHRANGDELSGSDRSENVVELRIRPIVKSR
ncbi:MAG TPA: hypothetical protein PK760_09190, partial [Flavobacteriales bacterium]|nr:hypothetical protein [Flavobacteriales bacterium]